MNLVGHSNFEQRIQSAGMLAYVSGYNVFSVHFFMRGVPGSFSYLRLNRLLTFNQNALERQKVK